MVAHPKQSRCASAQRRRKSDRPFDRLCLVLGCFVLAVGTLFVGVMMGRLSPVKFPLLNGLGGGLTVVGALATLAMIIALIEEFIGLFLMHSLAAIVLGVIQGFEREWRKMSSWAHGRSAPHGDSARKDKE